MTKNKIIPIAAILFLVAMIFFQQKKEHKQVPVSYTLFRTGKGWGYNILVNNSIFIHQENVPVIASNKSFDTEQQAKTAAEMVISKIKVNDNPMLDQSDIETIFLNKGQLHDKQ